MRILITGGCGFIGVNLIFALLPKVHGQQIRVVDDLSVGTREDLKSVAGSSLILAAGQKRPQQKEEDPSSSEPGPLPAEIELIVGDIRDGELAKEVCEGVDAIVHLAANTGVMPSIENPMTDFTTNVMGTVNYLEAARINGVRRFVFASSGAPLGEQDPPIHEGMAPGPLSPYGASKLAGEGYCTAYFGSFGVQTVALRFGNVYGPRSSHKGSVVAKFIRHILAGEDLPIYGDGKQTRDFIHVEDLVHAILLGLESPGVGGEVFQIATHREHTVGEVAEALNGLAMRHLGRSSRVVYGEERKGEVRRNYSDISKARRMLGFQPKVSLEKGLERTFLWFLERVGQC
ncbi:MAG: GDP-mannose 4,6-dehydratase [Deltaproteobacteria bacterium]|nr:GDP-mannose 4,6-dehydratase [Deltaproteobacteria bacterium]